MTLGLPEIPLPVAWAPKAEPKKFATPWDRAADLFTPPPDYLGNAPLWMWNRLNEYAWGKQREIAESLAKNRYTAVKSCHDAGKSFIASRLGSWWIDVHKPGDAFLVSTAPTNAQVGAVLWREILRAHSKADPPLPGKIVQSGYPQWKLDSGEMVGYGRKPADYSESSFQGIHSLYPLILLDEAGGIPKALFDQVDALATNENARVLAIGNPDDPTSHFADICKPDSGWNVIQIDGLRTPNFHREAVESLRCDQCRKASPDGRTLIQRLIEEEGIPYNTEPIPADLRPYLLSVLWVEERLHRWVGRVEAHESVSKAAAGSALFTAKVRGEFPTNASEGVIPLGWVEAAIARGKDLAESKRTDTGRRVVAVDVADTGTDETVIGIRHGNSLQELRRHPNVETMETVGYTAAALRVADFPDAYAVVDVIGIGAGVVSRLREMEQPVRAFNAAGTAKGVTDKTGEFKFLNQRAAAWWRLREMLDPSRGAVITLPDDEMLKADLTAPKWKVLSGGTIQIESKPDLRKRLGRSTDAGDVAVMAFWVSSESEVEAATPNTVSWYTDEEIQSSDDALLENWLKDANEVGDPTSW